MHQIFQYNEGFVFLNRETGKFTVYNNNLEEKLSFESNATFFSVTLDGDIYDYEDKIIKVRNFKIVDIYDAPYSLYTLTFDHKFICSPTEIWRNGGMEYKYAVGSIGGKLVYTYGTTKYTNIPASFSKYTYDENFDISLLFYSANREESAFIKIYSGELYPFERFLKYLHVKDILEGSVRPRDRFEKDLESRIEEDEYYATYLDTVNVGSIDAQFYPGYVKILPGRNDAKSTVLEFSTGNIYKISSRLNEIGFLDGYLVFENGEKLKLDN